jgi:hypothetical protein
LTYHVFQWPPPSFGPTPNPAEIEEEYVRNPGVNTHVDSGPLVRAVSMFETVTKIPVTNEGQGSQKQHRKHQSPYMGATVGKLYQEAKLSEVRALKLVIKLNR